MAVDGELGYPPEKCEEGGRDSFMSPYARYLDDDENCRAVSVFAGYSQTFVLDDQGRCWAFGVNVQCQLGIEESRGPTIVEIPELIRGLPPCDIEPIVHVAVGERHVLFLTSAGRVFGCGDNRNSQLNVSRHNINVRDMVKRPILLADNITRVCCGSFHSVLMNVFGQVVVAGCNDGGQLGIRESENALLLPDTALIPYAVWEKRISHKHAWIKEEKLVGEMVQWKHGVESGSVQIYANSNITLLQIKK